MHGLLVVQPALELLSYAPFSKLLFIHDTVGIEDILIPFIVKTALF